MFDVGVAAAAIADNGSVVNVDDGCMVGEGDSVVSAVCAVFVFVSSLLKECIKFLRAASAVAEEDGFVEGALGGEIGGFPADAGADGNLGGESRAVSRVTFLLLWLLLVRGREAKGEAEDV